MTYEESLSYIHSIPKFVRPLGNKNLSVLLDRLGNPQNDLNFVHIAGTNGKGSTAAMLSEILMRSGYKTGLYTSPYIEVFNERIQINGENISDSCLCTLTETVKSAMKQDAVSEFAFITAMAFLYFKQNDCDYVVLETGMGGRLDATNIIPPPKAAVLTSISLDHMQYLGDTIEEIAHEKCGIIKNNCTVISYPNHSVTDIIKNEAKKNNARLIIAEEPDITADGFIYRNQAYTLSLKGEFQPANAAVAIETAHALGIDDKFICEGLKNTYWPARFEYLTDNLIIDGGHNIDGIRALTKSLAALNRHIIIVTAMMKDKACEQCIKELSAISDTIITTQLDDMPRCENADVLSCLCGGTAVHSPEKALQYAAKLAEKSNSIICVCGSLYLAGEIKRNFRKIIS